MLGLLERRAHGYKDHAPVETEWIEPNSHYALAKASATLFCRYTAQARKMNLTTLRLYSAYGPYEEAKRLLKRFRNVELRHIPREMNGAADEMSNRAIDERMND